MSQFTLLENTQVVELAPGAPFFFDATMHKPDHFPASDNTWQPGVRWQTMFWQGKCLGLKFKDRGSRDRPRIALTICSEEELKQPFVADLLDEIAYRYKFQLDLTGFHRRFSNDPQLGSVIEKWRGMRPLNHSSLYEYLIVAIVLQNATVRRSVNMMQALFTRYGSAVSFDGKELYCFWEPEVVAKTAEQELRDLKVGYRAKSIKRVSSAFARKEIDDFGLRTRPKEEQRQALLGLYGIGPASVGYILVDVFHHLDELSHISPWEQKIYSKLLFDRDPDEPVAVDRLLTTIDERFGEYKALAVHYLWENLFWRRKNETVEWLEKLIRL